MAVFINGNVITLDGEKICESFSIINGIFTKTGSNSEILASVKDEEIIDLKGKTVLPGFNDGHMHFLNYAIQKNNVDIVNIDSIENLILKSKDYINKKAIPEGTWIVSRGWNHNLFNEQRLPTRYDLDNISTSHPIVFSRICGHIAVVNSKALELLKITKNSPNPSGGIIDKENGEPTGILRENALNIALDNLPVLTVDEIKVTLKTAFMDALACGITTIQTEDLTHCKNLTNLIKAYSELDKENQLPLRFILQLNLTNDKLFEEAKQLNLKSNIGSDFLRIGPVKLFQDGSLGGRTAAMMEPYCDEPHTGVLIYEQDSLDDLVTKAYNHGFQLTIHAIGDGACNSVLDSYERLINTSGKNDLRPTIVHAQFTNEHLLSRFKNLGVVANVQPSFIMTDHPIVEKAVGKERARESYAFQTMVKSGIAVAFSSDAPIESFNVFEGIYGAVNRKDLNGNPKEGFYPNECMNVMDAIKCYTTGSSFMNFEEDKKGKIKEGFYGDFIILSEDITKIPKEQIRDLAVLETYVSGIKRY
ncbi:MAG: amidohydrolase [Bacilli bacterium]